MKANNILFVAMLTLSATNFASASVESDSNQAPALQVQNSETIQSTTTTITDGQSSILAYDGKSWATCVLKSGLGSWAGSAFCAYGGFLTDIFG